MRRLLNRRLDDLLEHQLDARCHDLLEAETAPPMRPHASDQVLRTAGASKRANPDRSEVGWGAHAFTAPKPACVWAPASA